MGVYTSGQRLIADAVNVRGLIMYAYSLMNYQVSGTAHLMTNDERYDIVAKAEGDGVPTRDEFRQMLQLLLAGRFQLKFHREMRDMAVYALVVGKNGSKFHESAPDADPTQHFGASGRNTQVTMPKANMNDVIRVISSASLDRRVVDRTGLTGTYNIALTYTSEYEIGRSLEPGLSDIPVFSAVEDQLGLKLEPRKAVIEILVVDHIEQPSGN